MTSLLNLFIHQSNSIQITIIVCAWLIVGVPWTLALECVRKYPVAAFFILTLGLTCVAFIPYHQSYLAGDDGIPWFTFVPMIVGLFMAGVTGGRDALKSIGASIIRWDVNPAWYIAAIGTPFVVQFVSVLLNPLFGSAAPAWSNIPPLMEVMPMVALYAVFSGPLGEEIGWRGFALPRLLESHSALAASLILGSVWAIWHLPLYLVGDFSFYGAFMPVIAAIVFTWVFQNSKGSVLLAILMHVSHQNSVRYLGKVFTGSDHLQQQWIGVIIWVMIAGAIVLFYGASSFTKRADGHLELAAQI